MFESNIVYASIAFALFKIGDKIMNEKYKYCIIIKKKSQRDKNNSELTV